MLLTLDLNGTWRLLGSDGERGRVEHANNPVADEARYIDAQVPGEVHLDLWRAGRIDDPYVGTNCLKARWVEECYWAYRRWFDAPKTTGRVWLVFDRLDLVAKIFLNGVEVGTHKNVFYPCRIEVTGKLKPGRNLLTVHVEGGLFDVMDKPMDGYVRKLDQRLHKGIWLRKPQCQFNWDWSTRLINVGITGGVRLEWTTDPVRLDQLVPLAELSADLKSGKVRARLFVESAKKLRGELTVELAGQKIITPVTIKAGLHPVEATIAIDQPALWWPVGHGAQHLYDVRVTLKIAGKSVGTKAARVGFRHVRINQDPHPETGRYFAVEVNGKKIFCKGGNFVPPDMIFQRCDRARYDTLTDRALEANFNLLRIWGGGQYESDDFYELCDLKGILVWQEFIFACHKYPVVHKEFFDNVKAEATYNVRRLASHPSLVIWCGNNEMEWGAWEWGFDSGAITYPDYAMFHLTLPRLLKDEDPTRFYWPSSPYSLDGEPPNADHTGDQHPWQVGFANRDFRDYRKMTCRFPNEGGFLGPTALPTMLACLEEKDRRVQSFAWQVHDNSVDSWGTPSYPDGILPLWTGHDTRKLFIADYTYWGGLVHGEALSEYIHNFRRRMFSSAAAIFWMYNDCWPATRSWTIVDYYLRRTPSFHPVRRAMQPVTVVVAEEGKEIVIFGINETSQPVNAELRYGIFNLAGNYPLDHTEAVTLAPNASTRLASFPRAAWKNPKASAAFAILHDGDRLIARHRLILPLFKELKWPSARVNIRVRAGRATFESKTFVWGVCLDLDGERKLPDNFFDLYPGIPHTIRWTSRTKPKVLATGNL
ncbi:MAG: hypothetical protein WCS70_15580 [Verrucomicrobiota bacterium]